MLRPDCVDDYIARLKARYQRDNGILDLLHLIEMLRAENALLKQQRGPDEAREESVRVDQSRIQTQGWLGIKPNPVHRP